MPTEVRVEHFEEGVVELIARPTVGASLLVRRVSMDPMSVDENFIVSSRAPGITAGKAPVSLYGELEQNYGLVMDWGEDIVEATAASPSVATLLKVDIGSPLLKIQRHAYVADTVVDYSVSYYRADRYSLRVPLQRQGKKSPRNYRAAPPPRP